MPENHRKERAVGIAADRGHGEPVIVVGLDGSPTSWDAFAWAAGEALRCHGRLTAVYVTPAADPVAAIGGPLACAAARQAGDERARQLAGEACARAEEIGVTFRFVHQRGDAADVLTDLARAMEADQIVVGRSAKKVHQVAGSLGRRLAAKRDAPVVVVVP
jgi:nucleotide-binding universal stress UspA family protein